MTRSNQVENVHALRCQTARARGQPSMARVLERYISRPPRATSTVTVSEHGRLSERLLDLAPEAGPSSLRTDRFAKHAFGDLEH